MKSNKLSLTSIFKQLVAWLSSLVSSQDSFPSENPPSKPLPTEPKGKQVHQVRWGNDSKVTPQLRDSIAWMCLQLMPNRDLSEFMSEILSCMAFETAYSFSPSARNPHSNATGLIQFMPNTALPYFYSQQQISAMSADQKKAAGKAAVDKLASMTQAEQMNYVYRYFLPYKNRLSNLGDVYLAIFYPAAMNKPDDWVIARKGTKVYSQNSGFDKTNRGFITRGDTLTAVRDAYIRGSQPDLMFTGTVKPN